MFQDDKENIFNVCQPTAAAADHLHRDRCVRERRQVLSHVIFDLAP